MASTFDYPTLALVWRAFLAGMTVMLAISSAAFGQETTRGANDTLWAKVPAGEYERGLSRDDFDNRNLNHPYTIPIDYAFASEKPKHTVKITRDFWIGATEVTVAQFRVFVRDTGYKTDAERHGGSFAFQPDEGNHAARFAKTETANWRNPGFDQTDRHPVVCVSWNDAVAYCKWLSDKEGAKVRLPTEAEWELACRAGSESWYSFGSDPGDFWKHGNAADRVLEKAHENTASHKIILSQFPKGDGAVYTAPAASYQPNPFGIYDMHGNVWELCSDFYREKAYSELIETKHRRATFEDPTGPESPDRGGDFRVVRGGSWYTPSIHTTAPYRAYSEADWSSSYLGFRVARDL